MSKIYVLHNNRCTKSRNALKVLDEQQISYEPIYYLDGVLNEDNLKEILGKLGMQANEIVRKSEALYKENYKGKELSNSDWLKILVENPKLIERPIIFDCETAVVGRPTENVLEFLKKHQ